MCPDEKTRQVIYKLPEHLEKLAKKLAKRRGARKIKLLANLNDKLNEAKIDLNFGPIPQLKQQKKTWLAKQRRKK